MITLAGNLTLTFLWANSVANAQEVFAAQTRYRSLAWPGLAPIRWLIASSNDQSPATYQNHANVTHCCNRSSYVFGTSFTTTQGLRGRVFSKEETNGYFYFCYSSCFPPCDKATIFLWKIMRKSEKRAFVLFCLLFFFFCVKAKSEKTYLFRSPSQKFHPSPLYSIIIFIIVEAVSCTEQWRNGDSELQVNGFSPLFQTPSAAKIIFSRPKSLTRVIPLEGRIVLWSFF